MAAPLPTLLGLPAELRVKIFSSLFEDCGGLEGFEFWEYELRRKEEWPLEILQASKQIYNEAKQALSFWMSRSTLSYDGCMPCRSGLTSEQLISKRHHENFLGQYGQFITRVRIATSTPEFADNDILLNAFPQLQTLVIAEAWNPLNSNKECMHFDQGKMSKLRLFEYFTRWYWSEGLDVDEWIAHFRQILSQKGLVRDIGVEYEVEVRVEGVWASPQMQDHVSSRPVPIDIITDNGQLLRISFEDGLVYDRMTGQLSTAFV